MKLIKLKGDSRVVKFAHNWEYPDASTEVLFIQDTPIAFYKNGCVFRRSQLHDQLAVQKYNQWMKRLDTKGEKVLSIRNFTAGHFSKVLAREVG